MVKVPAENNVPATTVSKALVKIWNQKWLYLLLLPAIGYTIVFIYVPMYGISLAFRQYSPALGPFRSPWARPTFANFWFFQDKEFWFVMVNTLRISVLKFLAGWPAPIVLALLLNEVANRAYKRIVQTITYLPHFISWVIIAGIIYKLFDYEANSPLNALRAVVGLKPVALMGQESAFVPIVVASSVLKEIGWGTIIYLAAIMGIDSQLYEAAIVDGAGKWSQLWYITLPGILPTIAILLVLSLPGLLAAGFDQIYNLKNPMVERLANVTDIYVLRVGLMQAQYAYATAMGLVFSALGFMLTFAANRISRGSVGTSIW